MGKGSVAACTAALVLILVPVSQAGVTQCDEATHDNTIEFGPGEYVVDEAAETVRLTVIRDEDKSASLDCEMRVTFRTHSGTAVGDQDYVSRTGEVTINYGSTEASFTISLLDDANNEPTESFTVSIALPRGAGTIGDNGTAEVFITDDDPGSGSTATVTVTASGTGSATTQTVTTTRTETSTSTVTETFTPPPEEPVPGAALLLVAMALLAGAWRRR